MICVLHTDNIKKQHTHAFAHYKRSLLISAYMSGRLSNIDYEIQKCMSELDTQSYMPGGDRKQCLRDAELRALEAEVFGGLKGGLMKTGAFALGAKGDHLVDGKHDYVNAYYVDKVLDETYLKEIESCLSGDLYNERLVKDFTIFRDVKTLIHNSVAYTAIIHRTNNKKNEKRVCSVSLFETDSKHFISYLFTTNDPLAFDNFNCYRGNAVDFKSNPTMRCVEQDIFCDLKVKIAGKLAQAMPAHDLKDFVLTTTDPINYKTIVQAICNAVLNEDIAAILRVDRKNEAGCLTKAREYLRNFDAATFKANYLCTINQSTGLDYNLVPFDHYKSVGRKVFALPTFLTIFNSISMMCVLSTRMSRLKRSSHERELVASMIPHCVLECSDGDDIWAYKLKTDADVPVKMDWLVEDEHEGHQKMFEHVMNALAYQNKFISDFKERNGRPREQFIQLFDAANKHKLGLSEKILQSIWTKEIEFSPDLQHLISTHLAAYEFVFEYYPANLKETGVSSIQMAGSIGYH